MQAVRLPDNSSIADTIASVFSQPAYSADPPSLGEMILRWVTSALESLLTQMAGNPIARQVVRWTIILVAALLVARIAYAIFLHLQQETAWNRVIGSRGPAYDPWADAHRLAGTGRYTEAAHALYSGLLLIMARKGRIVVHESKTAGDYLHELQQRQTPTSAPIANQFGEFAQFYETVVYRLGACSADEFERLQALAAPLISVQS